MASQDTFITLEEHFMLPSLLSAATDSGKVQLAHPGVDMMAAFARHPEKMTDLSSGRIADMSAGNVRLQVLSHAPVPMPNEPTMATCIAANDAVASAISAHPERFRGFVWLDMREPAAAAAELRRRVASKQGFVGAFLEDHTPDGRCYDDDFFWPVFEAAQDCDVPVYIHPSFPPSRAGLTTASTPDVAPSDTYTGNYVPFVASAMGAFGLGWHNATALHFLRLFASGVFERFPKLQLVLGHDGEGLPFFLERLENAARLYPVGREGGERKRTLRAVWDENVWITTSGMFALAPMACILQNTKPERVMLSVDYPFSMNELGRDFMERLKGSGLVTREQWEGIGWGNATRLLKLQQ